MPFKLAALTLSLLFLVAVAPGDSTERTDVGLQDQSPIGIADSEEPLIRRQAPIVGSPDFIAEPEDPAKVEFIVEAEDLEEVCFLLVAHGPIDVCDHGNQDRRRPVPGYEPAP